MDLLPFDAEVVNIPHFETRVTKEEFNMTPMLLAELHNV